MLPADPAIEHRRTARFHVLRNWLVPVSIGSDNGGILLDLTQQGLAIQAVKYLSQGTTCTLEIYLPGFAADPVLATGKIAWSTQSKVAGIEFITLPGLCQQRLGRWLEAVTRVPARPMSPQHTDTTIVSEPEAPTLALNTMPPGGMQVSAPIAAHRPISNLRLWNGMMLLISTFVLLQLPLHHTRNPNQAPRTNRDGSQLAQSAAQSMARPMAAPGPASQQHPAITTSGVPPPHHPKHVTRRPRREIEEPEVIVRHYRNGHWE